MKIAIPLFRDDVSPRFGCCTDFLVATINAEKVEAKEMVDMGSVPAWNVPRQLSTAGVNTLICGGIHRKFLTEFETLGIKVYSGVVGSADDAIAAFVAGQLANDQFLGAPPCNRQGGGRGRGIGMGAGRGIGAMDRQPGSAGCDRPGRGIPRGKKGTQENSMKAEGEQ